MACFSIVNALSGATSAVCKGSTSYALEVSISCISLYLRVSISTLQSLDLIVGGCAPVDLVQIPNDSVSSLMDD